jgi:hypothetical protein
MPKKDAKQREMEKLMKQLDALKSLRDDMPDELYWERRGRLIRKMKALSSDGAANE